MKQKVIDDLKDLSKRETFKLIDERINQILEVINQSKKIRNLPVELLNSLNHFNVNFLDLIKTHIELIYVLYRSLFQSAFWEENSKKYRITTKAYKLNNDEEVIHKKIISHVDHVLAHQDIVNAKTRHLYKEEMKDDYNRKYYIVCNHLEINEYQIKPLVINIQNYVKNIYLEKFQENMSEHHSNFQRNKAKKEKDHLLNSI